MEKVDFFSERKTIPLRRDLDSLIDLNSPSSFEILNILLSKCQDRIPKEVIEGIKAKFSFETAEKTKDSDIIRHKTDDKDVCTALHKATEIVERNRNGTYRVVYTTEI